MTKPYSTKFNVPKLVAALLWFLFIAVFESNAQGILNKSVTLHYNQKRVADVLSEISRQAHFYFAYDGKLLAKDSVVSLSADNEKISSVLIKLFHDRYTYEERKNYLIILPQLRLFTLINTDITDENNSYSVSGLVADERTGERLMNVSVYEKQQLVSTLTDEHGYFRLKLRGGSSEPVRITVCKLSYKDTTVNFLQSVPISSRAKAWEYKYGSNNYNRVERTGLGGLFISARQKIQSLNIPDFFAKRPFQVSITPGLSTHGMFSPQVVNKFSLNLAGGYTAGVNGLEVGGLFNINKENSKYLQLAGVFNLVGGNMTGLQLAGAHNLALDTLRGVQLAVFTNKAEAQVSGLQLSALHNETRRLKGVQIGLVNVADTSEGASIGLLNITRNGFYKVSYSANNLANTNIALKTGTHVFYSALLTSVNISANHKFYAFGLGIGHDFMFNDNVYLSAEADYHLANNTQWDNQWMQGKLLLNLQLTPKLSLVAGPTYNHYKYNHQWHITGYQNVTHAPEYPDMLHRGATQTRDWLGWEAGIAFNGVFKPAKKTIDRSQVWYLGVAATGGIGWDEPYRSVSGGELFLQRDLGSGLTGVLSTGYTNIATDSDIKPVNIVPLQAGIRLKMARGLFIQGEIGAAFGPNEEYVVYLDPTNGAVVTDLRPYRSLMYSVSTGFSFGSGLEAGVKFEDYGLQSQYKQFALRLGYRLRLSK
ncbi:hypothetical protein KHS38_19910 [Mucilaginibacter sp. Bleaf8]|uniref:hypothetical protein n=1 Tax=Mucilaginibacter sp. Bleaf8 TaxID=2834430 RepID=UPI001BCB40B9|nr:hypothetical protein [Mucilaginibacter sp. Bleaf8]MBS7566680.1 hypothetical protein [Mucilaginibacter sp. Bleaf8]